MPLSRDFWGDLAWFRSALAVANCSPIEAPAAGEAVIAGSDASDLATGGLVWIDGAREEVVLRFTSAERRRPINYRELLGAVRVLERWGHSLRGRTVLVDLDSASAVGALRAMRSHACDMQELVRRAVALAQRHGVVLRSVHTSGTMLHRPDQTSRGAAVEEPRVRVRAQLFAQLEGRFGPFSDMVGAERPLASGAVAPGHARLWAHPT